MHPRRPFFGFGPVSKAALSGLLALLLLAAATLSVNPGLHQVLHRNGAVSHNLCLVCSLVKGQVDAAAPALVGLFAVFSLLFTARLTPLFVRSTADFLLSPSRAPPVR